MATDSNISNSIECLNNTNIEHVIKAIDLLQSKNKGRCVENVIEQCMTYGWDESTTKINIDEAIKSGKVVEKIFNSKIGLRTNIPDDINVIISDPFENVSTNTTNEFVSMDDFIDYKKYVNELVKHLNNKTSPDEVTKCNLNESRAETLQNDDFMKKYINSMECRISSLERENDFHRNIILKQQHHIQQQQETIEIMIKQNENKQIKRQQKNPVNTDSNELPSNNETRLPLTSQTRENENNGELNNEKKRITIIGDSLLNNIAEKGLQKNKHQRVKVRCHPGATTIDIIDHIKPEVRKKPDHIIIMAGTNDLTKVDIKTFQNLSEVLSIIRSESPDTAVSLSQVPVRNDIPNSGQKVADFNNKMKTFANHHNCGLLEMNKIDGSCLGKGKLHFNQKGNKMLASIFIDFCKDL